MDSGSAPEPGRHVLRVHTPEDPVLLNTLTGDTLPSDSSRESLSQSFFLRGQEEDALQRALSRPEKTLSLTLINTWACNLRCSHCSVLDHLEETVTQRLDPARLVGFVQRYLQARPGTEGIQVHFLGGEPLLAPESALHCLDALQGLAVPVRATVTTNGAVDTGDDVWALLRRLDRVHVSLDGDQASHDRQRRFLTESASPHERTLGFLKELVDNGLGDMLHVQAAVTDKHTTASVRAQWYRDLIGAGVSVGQASFQSVHPTARNPRGGAAWRAGLASPRPRTRPCCRFRASTHWVVEPTGDLRPDFYRGPLLGTLETPVEELFAQHTRHRERTMPALSDPRCRACPVLGLCWGGCVQGEALVGSTPSDHCDQQALMDHAEGLARRGDLAALRGTRGCSALES